jgi:hypothetical protein
MNLNPSTTRAGLTESARNPVCLASYLSVGVTGAMMATAHTEAAVVNIDITNVLGSGADISGVNAGMTFGQADRDVNNWLGCANAGIQIYFDSDYIGVLPSGWMMFASDGDARPRNFASGAMIDAAAPWSFSDDDASLYYGSDGEISPNFGAGSFMGFRFSGDFGTTWNYGYLEVLWTWGAVRRRAPSRSSAAPGSRPRTRGSSRVRRAPFPFRPRRCSPSWPSAATRSAEAAPGRPELAYSDNHRVRTPAARRMRLAASLFPSHPASPLR